MSHTLDTIEVVSKYKYLQIREINSDTGVYHRRVLTPNMDVSGECQEIQDKAGELLTDEVKEAYTAFDREKTIRDFGKWID